MTALRTREKSDDLDHWMKSFFREIDSDLGNEVSPRIFFLTRAEMIGDEGEEWNHGGREEIRL